MVNWLSTIAAPVTIGFTKLYDFLYRNLEVTSDTTEQITEKLAFTIIAFVTTFSGFLWGSMFVLLGLEHAAWSPYGFFTVLTLTLVYVIYSRNYKFLRRVQLIAIFLLPFGLQFSLGGFENSGHAYIWAFLAPLGALIFEGRRSAIFWFILFAMGIGVSAYIDDWLLKWHGPVSANLKLVFFLMNMGTVMTTVFAVSVYFITQVKKANLENERLLLNILPSSIVPRIKYGEGVIADQCDNVTVLFADIVGFTNLSNTLPVQHLVDLINRIFLKFDQLAETHKVEKIKTIGDAYMAAAGVPEPCNDHADRALALGRDMQRAVERFAIRRSNGEDIHIQIRVGIATGTAMAGVLGALKYTYDVWGHAVNEASRVESHGVPKGVLISESARNKLTQQWDFEDEFEIDLKGMGRKKVFLYCA